MSLLKRILGFFRSEDSQPVRVPAPSPVVEQVPEPVPRSVALSWREMLDESERIAGYFLRPVALGGEETVPGSGLLEALSKENVARLAARCKVLLPVTLEQWREADFRPLISDSTYFLISDQQNSGESLVAECLELEAEIRAAGGRLAICQGVYAALPEPGKFSGMVFLDVDGAQLSGFETLIRKIRQENPDVILAVDGVGTWSESRFLQSLGVALCGGSFTTTPDETEQADQISESRLVVVEMLNLLRRDAANSEIAEVAKRDPGVVLKLIAMANSPMSGLSRQVATLDDVILVLGRDVLYRWLALAMFRLGKQSQRDETLMVIALSRASFLERLAPRGDPQMAGELFLVGLFSLIDSLLRMPVETVIFRMNLPDKVVSALLKRPSPYVDYLKLALAIERGKLKQGLLLCTGLGLDPAKVWGHYSEAMLWASSDAESR
jgi:EAL and modified HD-GYP domain-containing signal transduction protein